MTETRSAHRYALSIISVAEEIGKVDDVSKDFGFIEKLIRETKEFTSFLKSPVVSKEKKKLAFDEIFKGRVGELTLKFVDLLLSKGREGLLPEIIHNFYRLRDERLGILNVTTRSTAKLTGVQEQQLVRQVEDATKKIVRMKYIQDPSLKGGFTVQFSDTVWDASVRRQLELLRERLVEGTA